MLSTSALSSTFRSELQAQKTDLKLVKDTNIIQTVKEKNSVSAPNNILILPEEKQEYITKNLDHEIEGDTVTSQNANSFFKATYKAEKWILHSAYKDPSEPFYSTDIKKFQIKLIAQKKACNYKKFLRPSEIRMENIKNSVTLKKTENLQGQELADTLLKDTPNGKSLAYLLKDLHLEVESVERIESYKRFHPKEKIIHFDLKVKPISFSID